MSTSNPATPSPAPSVAPSKIASKPKSKIVKLRITPSNLSKFPSDVTTSTPKPKPAPMPPTSPYEIVKVPPKDPSASEDHNSTSATSVPNEQTPNGTSQVNGTKRKGQSGPSGETESATKKQKLEDGAGPKARAKPGPKRRKGVDGEPGTTTTSHKINPKANTGAINANLRALDLTKKAPRKWQKRGLQFTSFTGKTWDVPRWNSTMRSMHDTASDADFATDTTPSSEVAKQEPASSNLHSDSGQGVNGKATPLAYGNTDFASSPAPQAMEEIVVS